MPFSLLFSTYNTLLQVFHVSCEVLICQQQKPALPNINRKTNILQDTAGGNTHLMECVLVQPLWKTSWHCLLKVKTVYAQAVI